MTISEGLRYGTGLIGQRDAMLLMTHITGHNSAYIMLHGNEPLKNAEEFFSYVNRCKQGEPLQYIIGRWDFMGRTFKTDSRALVPRPETELLVEEALAFLRSYGRPQAAPTKHDYLPSVGATALGRLQRFGNLAVLDLCTGGGCIAASIAASGNYNVTAADISQDALSLARERRSEGRFIMCRGVV